MHTVCGKYSVSSKTYQIMKLEKLQISNFRCFQQYDIEFASKVTVLIGRNGSGKTTMISAIHKALSFVFANAKVLGDDFLSAGNPSLKVNSFESNDYYQDAKNRTVASFAKIHAEGMYGGHRIEWEMYKRGTARAALYSSKYRNAFQVFMKTWKEESVGLPLLAYYSDSFPHKNSKETKFALETIKSNRIPRNFGYYQWDMEGACTSIWETRLNDVLAQMMPLYTPALRVQSRMSYLNDTLTKSEIDNSEEYKMLEKEMERISNNMEPMYEETEYVKERLRKFVNELPALMGEGYNIDYFTSVQTENGNMLNLVFENGKTILMQDLPTGYRRLYSIVLDMSYRAYILNGNVEPSGVVLIDEVDLHLHPSLEQNVIHALTETFPNVQFIVTTHSVSVVANLNTSDNSKKNNRILVMQEGTDQADEIPNVYGLDYNAVLRDFMDSPSRNDRVRILIDEYLAFCSLGLKKESESIYEKLVDLLGDAKHPMLMQVEKKRKKYDSH